MIEVFVLSNTKWQSAVSILKSHNLPYRVRHLKKEPFTFQEFKDMMKLTADGFDDVLTTKGDMYGKLQEQGIQFEALPMRKAYELIVEFPMLLKLPIVTDFETRTGSGVGGAKMFRPRQEKKEHQLELVAKAKELSSTKKEGIHV
jgi:regulatory protein spx